MTPQVRTFARRALWALPVWTAFLFLGSITHQPDPQTVFADFAAYVTTNVFLLSHLVASITGAAIGSIGVIGLMLYLQGATVAGKIITGMVATVVGNIFLTAVFGVSAFAQPAMGRMFLAGEQNAIDFYNQVYTAPLFGSAIVGLLLFMVGGAFVGGAIVASDLLPRWTGWVYAASAVGYVLSFILLPVGMSVFSVLFTVATGVIAWSAGQEAHRQTGKVRISPDP